MSASGYIPTITANHSIPARIDVRAATLRKICTIAAVTFVAMLPVTILVAPLKELIAVRYGATPFWTHSFMSVNMIGAILGAPLIALLADRNRLRRRVVVLALAADAVLLASMAVMPSLTAILIVRFFEGVAHILALSTLMAMGSAWADKTHRGRAMGIIGAAMMFGTACGTRLGGLIWAHLTTPHWTFLVAGAIAGVAAFGTLLIVREAPSEHRPERRDRNPFDLLRINPSLIAAYAYAFIDRLCVGVVISTFTLFLAESHGLDPKARSLLLVMFLLPFALLVLPAGWMADRIGRIVPMALGSIGFGVVFGCYGFLPMDDLYLAMLLSGIFSAIMFAPNLTLCADLAPPAQRGAAFTGFNIAGSLGFVLGPLMAGGLFTILTHQGTPASAYRVTFIATGALEILCALMTLPFLLRLRRTGVTR
ncbi:MAG: MFS transporter [Phycisphaerae bacterium]